MLDELHDNDLPLDTKDHLVGLDIGITQAHTTGIDECPGDDFDSSPLTGLIVNSETNTTRSTLTNELVEPPVADVLWVVVMTLLFSLQT